MQNIKNIFNKCNVWSCRTIKVTQQSKCQLHISIITSITEKHSKDYNYLKELPTVLYIIVKCVIYLTLFENATHLLVIQN